MISREPNAVAARFRNLIDRPDDEIDLAEAALLIAKSVNADLDVSSYLSRIEALAAQLAQRLQNCTSETERILALNRFLFDEQGFAPHIDNY